jgi:hypothetical protein
MSLNLLHPGDILLDYSYGLHGNPDQLQRTLDAAAKAGARGFFRYSAGAASDPSHPSYDANSGKLITPGEYRAIVNHPAGFDIIANSEWYATRITEGRNAGREDGRADAALWRSCGHPRGATVYVSWDAAPSRLKYLAVRRYLKGWRDGAQGYYEPDLYGGTPVLRALFKAPKLARKMFRIRYGWRTNAPSWNNDGLPYQPRTGTAAARAALVVQALKATPAHIWQTGNYWFGTSADENLVVRTPIGSRNDTLTAHQPEPKPEPDPTPAPAVDGPHRIVTKDGEYAFTLRDDGTPVVRHEGKPDQIVLTQEAHS